MPRAGMAFRKTHDPNELGKQCIALNADPTVDP